MDNLYVIGEQLKAARKRRYPKDDMKTFSLRIGVSRATYQKMEKGDLSVTLGKYFEAAKILELEDGFNALFLLKQSLFDD